MPKASQHSSANASWWASLKPKHRAELAKLAHDARIARMNKMLTDAHIVARLNKARTKRARRIATRRAALGMPPLALA